MTMGPGKDYSEVLYDANADFEMEDVEKLIEEARCFVIQIRQVISQKGK
jgi:hypothetical protein